MKKKIKTKIWHPEKSIILTKKIGKGCTIHSHTWIGKNVIIGNRVKIQALAFIPEGITIEDDCFIGPGVIFTNVKRPPAKSKKDWLKTLVKKGAMIGAGAVILPGLTIGKKAIIGAGAIITKDVPDNETWYGEPACKKG